jgi:hypothetical protein
VPPGHCQGCGEYVGDRGAIWRHVEEFHNPYYKPTPVLATPPALPETPMTTPGCCPKCGKYIGSRLLRAHTIECRGPADINSE